MTCKKIDGFQEDSLQYNHDQYLISGFVSM